MEHLKSFKKKMIIIVAVSLISAIGLISFVCIQHIAQVHREDSVQIMELLCIQYANQTNGHLESVEQTVDLLYRYALEKLMNTDDIYDVDNALSIIQKTQTMAFGAASNIETSHAVYLRLNPDLYGEESVFFMVRNDKTRKFEIVVPTDLRAYDRNDIEHVGWYYLPMEYGAPIWLEPYDNQNIDVYMITYAIPVFYQEEYIGVIGMDLDLSALHLSINEQTAFEGGYTYLLDRKGTPVFDTIDRKADDNWLTVSRSLRNGMVLSVTAPQREINTSQRLLVRNIILTAVIILAVAMGVAVWFAVQMNHSLTTALEKAYQTQQDALDAANQASEAKSDFLSRMSHDIRTPMNAIIGMTAIAGAHLDDQEKLRDCISKISVSSHHLLGIINDILDMSKIESGKLQLREAEFQLSDLIDELLELISPQAMAKRHTIKVYLHNVEHENLVGDEGHLQQALVNILSNAVKYTPDGGNITVSVTEKATQNPHTGRFEFVFQDNGIGMSPELTACIFDPFERGEDLRVSKIQGTGLGMAITHSIIQHMGGTIQVESKPGKGSKFTITITLKLRDTVQVDTAELVGLPILVADDDQISCESTSLMLEELGMTSEWAFSGEEAVEKAVARHNRNEDYFAVIVDWKMPDMDGIEAACRIRNAVGTEIPVLILSAFDWNEVEEEARAAGICAFLNKPVFKSNLAHAVLHLLHPGGREKETEPSSALQELKEEDYSGRRVLLVEDNELNLEIATELLSTTGVALETARDGDEALELIRRAKSGYYDMIFMDIQMPHMNGYEASKAIRALDGYWKTVPIIAMTANTFDEDVQAALRAGMNEHIGKPIDLQQLSDVMRRWLYQEQDAMSS